MTSATRFFLLCCCCCCSSFGDAWSFFFFWFDFLILHIWLCLFLSAFLLRLVLPSPSRGRFPTGKASFLIAAAFASPVNEPRELVKSRLLLSRVVLFSSIVRKNTHSRAQCQSMTCRRLSLRIESTCWKIPRVL